MKKKISDYDIQQKTGRAKKIRISSCGKIGSRNTYIYALHLTNK